MVSAERELDEARAMVCPPRGGAAADRCQFRTMEEEARRAPPAYRTKMEGQLQRYRGDFERLAAALVHRRPRRHP